MNDCISESKEHAYNPAKYVRDDSGFFLDCIHCNKTTFFDCDTEDELYSLFGFDDEDEDD